MAAVHRIGVDAWLGPAFLEAVLRRALQESELEVTRGSLRLGEESDAEDAEDAEDGGSGRVPHEAEVRRVRLEWAAPGRSGDMALLVKAETVAGAGAGVSTLRRLRLFARERAVYASALPAMERLRRRPLPGDSAAPTATTGPIASTSSPPPPLPPPLAAEFFPCDRLDALVITDLRAQGFRAADARRGLSLEHCAVALAAVARFHAGSVAMRLQRPDALLDFRNAFFSADNEESLAASLEPALAALARRVARWPGFQRFGPRIEDLRSRATAMLVEAMRPDGARPLVLVHGDLCPASLLFRYDDKGVVKEARIRNFQLAHWGSPAVDLQFFLYTAPSEVVRAQFLDTLVAEYHRQLCAELTALRCWAHVPSLAQLQAEMADKAAVGLLAALCVLGGIMGDAGGDADGDGDGCVRYRNALQRMLPLFEEQRLLL